MNFKKVVTIAATAGALAALAVPAMAETSLYGSARLTTFWNTVDSPTIGSNTDFQENLQANSRLGINFTNGTHGGKVELGVGTAGVTTRHMYGTEKFNFGTVLVGQTENPYYFISSSVAKDENVSNGYGSLWDTRQPQIKLTLNNGFYVAAITPSSSASAGTTENYLPKMNAGYEGKAGNFAYGAGVLGQTYKVQNGTTGATTDTVTSLLGYFHGTLKSGAAELKFNLGVGQNMGNMGFVAAAGSTQSNIYAGGEDTTTIEGFVQGGYAVSPTVKLNAGFGYVTDDNDRFAKADNRMQIFVNAPIVLAKGFSVTPEFSYFDQLDNTNTTTFVSTEGNKEYLVGAKWQMDF